MKTRCRRSGDQRQRDRRQRITVFFEDTEEGRKLHDAVVAHSEKCFRTPAGRHIRYVLSVLFGLTKPAGTPFGPSVLPEDWVPMYGLFADLRPIKRDEPRPTAKIIPFPVSGAAKEVS